MKYRLGFLVAVLFGAFATAGTIKTWSSGEYITSTDLNAALSHIHTTMVGGHGPRLINSDIGSGAAIAHSKMATPALLPKAWAYVPAACATPATCTMADSSGITSIVGTATTGEYTVTFDARSNANYGVLVTAVNPTTAGACTTVAQTTTTITIHCVDGANPHAATDTGFSVLLMDSEN